MTYSLAVLAAAVGVAVMIFLKPLRPVSLVAFAVAGFIARDTELGDLVRQGVTVVGRGVARTDFAWVVPYLGAVAAVVAAVVLASAVLHWSAGIGVAVVALAFPTLLVLSGDSPPAVTILGWLGSAADWFSTATKVKGI